MHFLSRHKPEFKSRQFLFGLCSVVILLGGCPGFGTGSASNGILLEVPTDPTYEAHVSLVLDFHCAGCHGETAAGGAPSDFRLDVYEDDDRDAVFEKAERIIVRAVESEASPMPPFGAVLDPVERETLEIWLAQGAPEGGE